MDAVSASSTTVSQAMPSSATVPGTAGGTSNAASNSAGSPAGARGAITDSFSSSMTTEVAMGDQSMVGGAELVQAAHELLMLLLTLVILQDLIEEEDLQDMGLGELLLGALATSGATQGFMYGESTTTESQPALSIDTQNSTPLNDPPTATGSAVDITM